MPNNPSPQEFLNLVALRKHLLILSEPYRWAKNVYIWPNVICDLLKWNQTWSFFVNLSDYNIFRKDRNRIGGGVTVYVRNTTSTIIRSDLMWQSGSPQHWNTQTKQQTLYHFSLLPTSQCGYFLWTNRKFDTHSGFHGFWRKRTYSDRWS